jgi:PadR family transcriptional regulator, regulatory protein PadR
MDTPLSARAALLAALMDGESYGMDLIERVKRHTGGLVNLNEGAVYPALRALEEEGLVRFVGEGQPPAGRGGRPRRYYELTAAGKRAARIQSEMLIRLLAPRDPS